MFESLKAHIAEHDQEKLEKAAPASAADQAFALQGESFHAHPPSWLGIPLCFLLFRISTSHHRRGLPPAAH